MCVCVTPKDTKKQFYALGFALYGLSEYARATGDREALDYALQDGSAGLASSGRSNQGQQHCGDR